MQAILTNGIHIEYECFGPNTAPSILLIMGLGVPSTRWNIEICLGLVARGYRVIRFDNRDCGLSSHLDDAPVPNIGAALSSGTHLDVPYTLDDMAEDCVLLLDVLSVDSAHIVGISMGGAIAQILAAQYPERTLSMTCIMSSTGNPSLPRPSPAATAALFAPLPKNKNRDSIVSDGVQRYRQVASPAYSIKESHLISMLEQEYERAFYPRGVVRQLAAILANGDRRALLQGIRIPSLVIHGEADPLVKLECGQDICNHLSDVTMIVIEGMGHDLPIELTDQLVDGITTVCKLAALTHST